LSSYGIIGRPAPELRVPTWIDNVDGKLLLAQIEQPIIYLYAFQAWCPGCNQLGFPTLLTIKRSLESLGLDERVKFIAIQTVFEGFGENTARAARAKLVDYGLTDIALGHDARRPSQFMMDYRTGGTPWTVIIGPKPGRNVLFNDFHVDATVVLRAVQQLLSDVE
jgi:hypothetical protein